MLYSIIFYSFVTLFVPILCILEPSSNPCASTSGGSTDPPKISLVTETLFQDVNEFKIVQFNCSGRYPIQWTFTTFPREADWNVSYARIAEDVLEESTMYYNSTLNFFEVSATEIANYGTICRSIESSLCSSPISQDLLHTLDKDFNPNMTDNIEMKNTKISNNSTCSLWLWFDETSKQYFCTSNNDTVQPKLSFYYCSTPTDCEATEFVRSQKPNCILKPERKLEKGSCDEKNCTSLRLEGDFPIPKFIACSDKNKNAIMSTTLQGYFRSTKEVKGHPINSYLNWEEMTHPEDDDMVFIQVSNEKPLAHEPIDLSCMSSFYYFADGTHLTLKHVSSASFSEVDLKTMKNVTMQKTIELNNHGDEIPIRRTLLAEGIKLDAGDYQATCYAPLWNSTQWVKKSILISVSDATLPVFITGNKSRDIEFKANMKLTCLAKGYPPPRLTWVYDNVRVPPQNVYETEGSQKFVAWSVITLPKNIDGFRMEFKCHAQNAAGFDEKLFVVNKNDESVLATTKVAAGIIVIGFLANLVVGYFCWRYLFSEEADTAVLTFVRSLRRKTKTADHQHSNGNPNHYEEHPV